MEKYAVVLDDDKSKTAGAGSSCPDCGIKLEQTNPPKCSKCGTKPFEKRPTKEK